jgi:hypothetical protein
MKIERVRTFALALPETSEEPHIHLTPFRVKGKKIAGMRVHLRAAPKGEVFALVEEAWRHKAPKKLATSFKRAR